MTKFLEWWLQGTQTDNVWPSECRLGRKVPRQCCHWSVIWGGHRVSYHSCSLCTVIFYGEFTLKDVRTKWCRLIWCHLLMPWIFYCCRYVHMRHNSVSQSPSSVPFCPGQQTYSFHRLLSEKSLCLHLVFHNCLSDTDWI